MIDMVREIFCLERTKRQRMQPLLSFILIGIQLASMARLTISMRIPRPWREESACDMIRNPGWPFTYSKYSKQEV